MLWTAVMLLLASVAAVTDMLWHRIYNWNTYPGIVLALAVSGLATLSGIAEDRSHPWTRLVGWIEFGDSLTGFLACGLVMLVCFVFFQIGGGDVKLLAMLGAFLGWEDGISTLLWTFVLGGAMGLVLLVWRVGAATLVVRCLRHLLWTLRLRTISALTDEERKQLEPPLFLAPNALAAACIVRFDLLERLEAIYRAAS
jgi:Flp pilus assembly protein protease CpaA